MPEPAYRLVPDYRMTYGDLAARVGEELGMPPDDDQRDILDAIFAENEPGIPAAFEVGVIAPRQNIKTSTLEIAALTDLFVLGIERHIWTAHLSKTARSTFEHMVGLIESNPDFRRRCRQPREGRGDETIELRSGQRIEFYSRSSGGGRGQVPPPRRITLDEGLFLAGSHVGALMPTLATRRDAQIRYGSSAGLVTSEALRAVRDRGRAGTGRRLAYFEWCAPAAECERDGCTHALGTAGCALDRVDLLELANPALGRRITLETLQDFRESMPPGEFAREFFGWWDDPASEVDRKISSEDWTRSLDVDSQIVGALALAVDVTPDRSRGSLAACGVREDGRRHGELILNQPGTGWLPTTAGTAARKAGVRVVALDAAGPAGSLIPALEAEGLQVVAISARELGQACGALVDDVAQDRWRHLGQPELDAALAGASTRTIGDGAWAWARRSSAVDISPLVAITVAAHALQTAPSTGGWMVSV